MMSAVGRSSEKIGNTYRCRGFIVLVDAITDADPEHDVKSCDDNNAKSKVTCSNSNFPQSHYECMGGEDLVSCISVL